MTIQLTKTITNVVASSGTFTITLEDVEGCQVGMKAQVAGLPTPSWNIEEATLTAVDTVNLTVSYSHGNFTVTSQAVWGQFHLYVNWITTEQVSTLLGWEPTDQTDVVMMDWCVGAAQDFAWRRRASAGYTVDHPNVPPSQDVTMGCALYAMSLFRERGSVDSFASFTDTPTVGVLGTMGQINRLLGINRMQVG